MYPQRKPSQEYEDDYEADDYSEDDDSSHLSSPRLSPKKEVMPTMQEASDEETDLNHTNTATAPQQSGQEVDPLEKSEDFEDEFEAGSDHTASGGLPDAEDADVAEDAELLDDFDAEDQVERIESDPDPPVAVMEGDEIDHNSVPSIKSDPDRNLVDKAPSEEIAQALSEHMRTVAASNESESDKVVVNDHNEVNETNDEEIAQALSEHMRTVAASNESESDKVVVNDHNEVNETNDEEIAQALSEHMRTVAASNESESDKVVVNDHNEVNETNDEEIAQALSEHMRTVAASNESESDKVVVNDRNEVNETNDEEIAQALSEHMRTVAASNESESDKVVVNDRNEVNETNEDIAVDKKVSEIDEINEVNEENEVSHDYTDFEADSQSPSKKEALPSESGVGLAGDISGGISASASPSSIGIGGAVAGPGPPRGMSQGRGWSEDFEDDDGINEDQELTNERAWDPEGAGVPELHEVRRLRVVPFGGGVFLTN